MPSVRFPFGVGATHRATLAGLALSLALGPVGCKRARLPVDEPRPWETTAAIVERAPRLDELALAVVEMDDVDDFPAGREARFGSTRSFPTLATSADVTRVELETERAYRCSRDRTGYDEAVAVLITLDARVMERLRAAVDAKGRALAVLAWGRVARYLSTVDVRESSIRIAAASDAGDRLGESLTGYAESVCNRAPQCTLGRMP